MELRKGKQPEDFLFTRENGEQVRDFRETWQKMCLELGLGRWFLFCGEV
jgi:hypothetical protein